VVATDVGLRVTSGVFEVTGARATASKVGLDRFWGLACILCYSLTPKCTN
jgi:alkylation response protein AidB-like acyl-CoA dehydrogenase